MAITELPDVHVTEITWRPVGAWTRGLESLRPLCPVSDTERGRLRTVELCADVTLLSDFTYLFVGTGSRVIIDSDSWSKKSVMWRRPFLSLGITEL